MPSRPPLHTLRPRRIVLIKPSALGDIAHALPVLSALRWRFPEAHITWVVNRAYEAVLDRHPDLNAVLTFDRGAARSGWLTGVRTLGRLMRTTCKVCSAAA
jgi:ADP-heptose:LPS heptosyltransferase